MTQSMDKILMSVYNNEEVDKYIWRVVPYSYVEDMKQHLIIEFMKVNILKLNKMFIEGSLKYLAFRIVSNQMDPKCGNCFYKKVIKPSLNNELKDINIVYNEDRVEDDRLDRIEDVLRGIKPWKVNLFRMYYEEGLNFRQISEKTGMNIKTVQSWIYEVKNILKSRLTT